VGATVLLGGGGFLALSPRIAEKWGYNEDSELVLILAGYIELETYRVVEKYFIDIIHIC
jgi:hypothetical protein